MWCAAVRTVQGCGERVQYLEKLSRTAPDDMQPVRASFTRSGPNRETVSVGPQGKQALNYREAGSERACGAGGYNQQERIPLRHLGMSRGDGEFTWGRTFCLLRSRLFWEFGT